MLIVICTMLTGIAAGAALRRWHFAHIGRATMLCIWLLLFFMGLSIGGNERIMQSLGTLGIEAACISFCSILGSVLVAWRLQRYICKTKEE